MSDAGERGAALERRVAAFMESIGYTARTNVVLEGRSGGRHEIDVLAEKVDALTTIRIAVECKAWSQPIEKDVVSKLAYVLGDLGINKGIIAALAGCRSGAEQAAAELGIELWGADELAARFGQVALAELRAGPAQRLASGFEFRVAQADAQREVARLARGRLGFGREETAWLAPVWVPASIATIALTRVTGRVKKVSQTRRVWNTYELITGAFMCSLPQAPELAEVDVGRASIAPIVKETQIAREIGDAFNKHRSVSTQAARDRHLQRLRVLGIPMPNGVTVETSVAARWPVYAAILQRGDGERVVAIDGLSGESRARLSAALSSNIHWLRDSLAGP